MKNILLVLIILTILLYLFIEPIKSQDNEG